MTDDGPDDVPATDPGGTGNDHAAPRTNGRATAWSADGVSFQYRSPLEAGVPLGGYVALSTARGTELGQILTQDVVEHHGRRLAEGAGRMVPGHAPPHPFDLATVEPAPGSLVAQRFTGTAVGMLGLGHLVASPDHEATLRAAGFNRHTFLCGQSGSGKTYALGVLLEQLVLHTTLPLLVIDPNGDHVHLGSPRSEADDTIHAEYAAAADDVRVLRAEPDEHGEPLRVRFAELGAAGIAAILRLDPLADRTLSQYLLARDFVAVQGIVTAVAVVVALASFAIDVINAFVDPRVRY